MALVSISFSGDDARLRAQHDRLLGDQEKLIAKYRAMAGMSKKSSSELARETQARKRMAAAESEAQKQRAEGAKITQSLLTPQERFNALIKESIRLQQSGAMGRDVLQRRFKQLKEQLRVEQEAISKAKQANQIAEQSAASKAKQIQQSIELTNQRKREAAQARAVAAAEREKAEAAKLIQSSETPQERFKRRISEITALRGKEGVTTDLLKRKYREAREELQRAEQATDDYKNSLRAKTEAERKAAAVVQSTLTAGEKYKRQLGELKKLHRDGYLTLDQLRRGRIALREEFRKSLQPASQMPTIISKVGQLAAAYLGVGAAVGQVSKAIQTNIELQEKSLEIADRVARSQQEGFKNLAGLSTIEKQTASTEAKRIAADGLPIDKVTEAIGSAFSAGGQMGLEKAIEAVEEAAKINRLTPDNLPFEAAAALDIAGATGSNDIAANLGFIKSVGKEARPSDPMKVSVNAAKAVQGAVNALPGALREVEAERQRAAITGGGLFAALTKSGTDITGESASTAVTMFVNRMEEVFSNLPQQKIELQGEIKKLEDSSLVTDAEQLRIDAAKMDLEMTREKLAALDKIRRKSKEQQQDELQLKLAERQGVIDLRTAQESSVLSTEETATLQSLRQKFASLSQVVDPGRVEDRVQALRGNDVLRETLFEKEFGEQRFKAGFEQILDSGSQLAKDFDQSIKNITFDKGLFNRLQKEIESATPELQVGALSARLGADSETALNNIELQTLGLIRRQFTDVEARTRLETSNLAARGFGAMVGSINAMRVNSSETVDEAIGVARSVIGDRLRSDFFDTPEGQAETFQARKADMERFLERLDEIAATFENVSKQQAAAAGKLNNAAGNLGNKQAGAGAQAAAGRVGGDL